MKTVSIVIPCFNEEENIIQIYEAVRQQFEAISQCSYEILFIDNCSNDSTPSKLRELAAKDSAVKVILNNRNFGIVRSPTYGMWQATGDAVIPIAADFQEPPDLIPDMVSAWLDGSKMVLAIRENSQENRFTSFLRRLYYRVANGVSEIPLVENYNGYGLYDREVIDTIKNIEDRYPYFRGLVNEVGFDYSTLTYSQPNRQRGITKNNFYTLYDMAMNGLTSHSKVPLRMVTLLGFLGSAFSLFVAFLYLIYKLVNWNSFEVGIAPLVIGLFLFNSIILMILGILGEYIGFINTRLLNRPLVIERERINFESSNEGQPGE